MPLSSHLEYPQNDLTIRRNQKRLAGRARWVDLTINSLLAAAIVLALFSWKFPVFSNELYVQQGSFNFGDASQGTAVSHSFIVRNLHPWSTCVTALIPSCGCTKATSAQTLPYTLAPFSMLTIHATMDTTNKSGPVSQSIYVKDNHSNSVALLSVCGAVTHHHS